jgi:hypothetical protein
MGGNATDNSPLFSACVPVPGPTGGRGRGPAGAFRVFQRSWGLRCAVVGVSARCWVLREQAPLWWPLVSRPLWGWVGVAGWGLLSWAVGVLVGASVRVLRVSGASVGVLLAVGCL